MVRKITVDVPTHASSFEAYQRPVTVSLPAPPFDLKVTYNDRPETRPRSLPIRSGKEIGFYGVEGSVSRKLWDYGVACNFQCTIAEAAHAIGANLETAKTAAREYGFRSRFFGVRAGTSKAMYGAAHDGGAMLSAVSAKRQGFNVDENLLPLDVLINDTSNA